MVLDEDQVRAHCRTYIDAMRKYFPAGSVPLFASKALCFKELYRIVSDEGMGCDVVSPGELYTMRAAGFPLDRAYFHGNNKTDEDIEFGMDSGVGCFVADNRDELCSIDRIARIRNKVQKGSSASHARNRSTHPCKDFHRKGRLEIWHRD